MSPSPSRRPASKAPPREAKSKRPAKPSSAAKPAPRKAAEPESPATITAIEIEGFKCFGKAQTVEIRPLTLLAGANSSGKSSLMQPLLLMKQTLNATYDPGPLLLSGPNANFTEATQLLNRSRTRQRKDFVVRLIDGNERCLRLEFTKAAQGRIDIAEMAYSASGQIVTLRPEMSPEAIREAIEPLRLHFHDELPEFEDVPVRVIRDRCLLSVRMRRPFGVEEDEPATHLFWRRPFVIPWLLASLVHVPAMRGNRDRVYRRSGIGRMFPGRIDDYVASLVEAWQTADDDQYRSLTQALMALRLTRCIAATPVDDVHLEIRVGRVPVSDVTVEDEPDVNVADVGFGISQVLPVLVALLAAEPGQVVYLEQPEVHLHPRAQTALASVLADAARRGVRVVAETHSSLLLLGVQTLVAEGKLDPKLVKLHWFTRDDHGATRVTSSDLDDEGAFGTDWPEDFGSVELDAQRSFIRAVARHRTGKNGQ